MAYSVNIQILLGNLGHDAKTKFNDNNTAITRFQIATTHKWKNKEGDWIEETEWHNVVCFNLSDWWKDYLKKGKKVYVKGRTRHRQWDGADGTKKSMTEVLVENWATDLVPLSSKDYNDFNAEDYDGYGDMHRNAMGGGNEQKPDGSSKQGEEDDDLPF